MKEQNGNFEEQKSGFESVKSGEKLNTLEKLSKYLEENNKKVIGIFIGAVVVIAGFFVAKYFINESNEANRVKASTALSRILPYYQSGDFKTALEGDSSAKVRGEQVIGLKEIADEFGGTETGKSASLMAGYCLISNLNYQEALKYFEKALTSESDEVKSGAYAGVGAANDGLKNYDEAAKNYEKAVALALTPATKSRYMYYAGLSLEMKNDKEKAEKMYKEIIDDITNRTEFTGLAKAGLTRLGTVIE